MGQVICLCLHGGVIRPFQEGLVPQAVWLGLTPRAPDSAAATVDSTSTGDTQTFKVGSASVCGSWVPFCGKKILFVFWRALVGMRFNVILPPTIFSAFPLQAFFWWDPSIFCQQLFMLCNFDNPRGRWVHVLLLHHLKPYLIGMLLLSL